MSRSGAGLRLSSCSLGLVDSTGVPTFDPRPTSAPSRWVELDEPSAIENSVVLHGIDTDVTSLCGQCGAPLIEGADPAALSSVAIRCGECAAVSGFVDAASSA